MILEPISIATGGYVGIGPTTGTFCPWDIAIATDGYVRLDVEPVPDRRDGDGGHGAVIWEPRRQFSLPIGLEEDAQLALLAMLAIDEMYE